jgi:hypothetical protein
VTYFEFGSTAWQDVVVPWTVVASDADAAAIADILATAPIGQEVSSNAVSISAAILAAMKDFDRSGAQSDRRSIDISGDGPNDQGLPVTAARDMAVAGGATINGLPILVEPDPIFGPDGLIPLADYYRACVIGGPAAFSLPISDAGQFDPAIKRKLIQEIAALSPRFVPAAEVQPQVVDCLDSEATAPVE